MGKVPRKSEGTLNKIMLRCGEKLHHLFESLFSSVFHVLIMQVVACRICLFVCLHEVLGSTRSYLYIFIVVLHLYRRVLGVSVSDMVLATLTANYLHVICL